MNFLTVLIALLAFGFLIFVHELGHYIAARLTGIKVYEFSIGMGPKLVWYDSKKTGIRWSTAYKQPAIEGVIEKVLAMAAGIWEET